MVGKSRGAHGNPVGAVANWTTGLVKGKNDMLLEWLSGTPLGNERFLEIWEWVQTAYNFFIVFNVFRFSFHVLRGATEEFIERSRLMQFVFRWWRPILAVHFIYYALSGAYNNWFLVAFLLLGLVLVTINLILQFSIERLERKIQAFEDLEKERQRKREQAEADADADADGGDRDRDSDSDSDEDRDEDGEGGGDRKGA